jgi:hypothetical protein
MTSWTAFVGQVARLRRLIVRAFARTARRRAPAADEPLVAAAEEPPAGGPPAHWVERVRRGAPGLLEPSLRSQGVPVRPTAEHFVPPEADAEPELEPPPPTPEEVEREDVPPEPAVVSRPRARTASTRRASPLRKVVRRIRIPSAERAAPVDDSPAPASDAVPVEAPAATNPVPQLEGSPVAKVTDRPRATDERSTTALRAARPAEDETEPPPQRTTVVVRPVADETELPPQRTTVVEFEAPLDPSRTVRADRAVRDDSVTASATEPPAAELAPVEHPFDGTRILRARERPLATPPPRHAANVEHLREPVPRRAPAPVEPSFEAAPRSRGRDDPLPSPDADPWPELPAPLDEADGEVDAALRAWARQERLDREQTRL